MTQEKGAALAAMGDLAMRSNRVAANLHAFFSVGFGSSLIVSGITERDTASPTYVFLQATPHWPIGMGTVFVIAGIILSIANLYQISPARYWVASIGFALQGLGSLMYTALFVLGTFTAESAILGPQWIYGVIAALSLTRSVYACMAARIAYQLGD